MRRGGLAAGLAASPTLVGAVTVMIVILAIFLAYNANTGLPFVPSYRVSAEVPNANSLVPGNEVRIGVVRVGLIEQIEPEQQDDGTFNAKLDLKLDADVEPLPEDSTMIVRARSRKPSTVESSWPRNRFGNPRSSSRSLETPGGASTMTTRSGNGPRPR